MEQGKIIRTDNYKRYFSLNLHVVEQLLFEIKDQYHYGSQRL